MISEKLLNAFENISDEIIEEASPKMMKAQNAIWLKWGAVAACFILVVVSLFYSKIFDLSSGQIKTPASTENVMPPTSTSADNINSGDHPDTIQLSYKKSDYYLIALTLNDEKPSIDFNALFGELSVKPTGTENPTCDDYFNMNKEAYDKLTSYGNDTLLYCSCYMIQNWQEYRDNTGEITKAVLVFDLMLKMTAGEPYDNPYQDTADASSLNDRYTNYIKYTVARWHAQGNEAFQKNAPGLFQMVRAMTSVPDYRFLITDLDGIACNENVLANATQAFIWVLDGSDHAKESLENAVIPEAPKDVCNENTQWQLTQDADGTVTLTFINASTGTDMGKMIYHPNAKELTGWMDGIYGSVEVSSGRRGPR